MFPPTTAMVKICFTWLCFRLSNHGVACARVMGAVQARAKPNEPTGIALDASCPAQHYCLPRSPLALEQAKSLLGKLKRLTSQSGCPGWCVPCNADPVIYPRSSNGTLDEEDFELVHNAIEVSTCEKCSFDAANARSRCIKCEQTEADSMRFALLKDLDGRERCFKRPRANLHKALPGLCTAATQGAEDMTPLSAGEMWTVVRKNQRPKTVPARLQITGCDDTTGTCEVYIAIFEQAHIITDEMRTHWAGSSMLASHTYTFDVHKDESIIGNPKDVMNMLTEIVSRSETRVYHQIVRSGMPCTNCIWSLVEFNEAKDEYHLSFNKDVYDLNTDEKVPHDDIQFILSNEAMNSLGACIEYIQSRKHPKFDKAGKCNKYNEAYGVRQLWENEQDKFYRALEGVLG